MQEIGPRVSFETNFGEMTFAEILPKCDEEGGTKKLYYLDVTPLADPRWTLARVSGRIVVWCREAAEMAVLKELVKSSRAVELFRLGWGASNEPRSSAPVTVDQQNWIESLRAYLKPERISVEPANLDPPGVLSAVELSTTGAAGDAGGPGAQAGVLRAVNRAMTFLRGSEAPESPHGRLLLNLTNTDLQAVLALTEDGSLEVSAVLLFLLAVTQTGIPLPAAWQPALGRLIDKAVQATAGGHRSPGPDTAAHTVCFFAHQFNRDKAVLAAMRAVLEHSPFYWEVRSADETTKDPRLFENVLSQVKQSHIVIAEISEGNPNVMLEAGLAYGLPGGRPVVLLSDAASQKKISDLQSHLLFPYDSARLTMERTAFQDRFRSWVMQQDALSRFLRRRPFLSYRHLQEVGLVAADEAARLQSIFPDANRFATSPPAVAARTTGLSEARIRRIQDLFQLRLRDSNLAALRV
jgi:hypothetical protein